MANKDFERLDNEYDAISKLLEEKDAEYFDREHPKTLVWHRESIAITKRLFSRLHVLLTEAKAIGYTELEVYIKERLTFAQTLESLITAGAAETKTFHERFYEKAVSMLNPAQVDKIKAAAKNG